MNSKFALSQILSGFRKPVDSPEPFIHTHTRIGDKSIRLGGGSYKIPADQMGDFAVAYKNHVFDKTPVTAKADGSHLAPSGEEYLTEKQNMDDGPIMVDLDMRYATNITTRQHNSGHVDDLVELYANTLNKILYTGGGDGDTDDTTTSTHIHTFPVYVMEKPSVRMEEDKTKDGIHMVIGLGLDKAGRMLLRNMVLEDISNVWDDMPITNTWEDVVDEAVVKGAANWQMYGSRKPGYDAYKITGHYTVTVNGSSRADISNKNLKHLSLDTVLTETSARYTGFTKFPIAEALKPKYDAIVSRITLPTQRSYESLVDVGGVGGVGCVGGAGGAGGGMLYQNSPLMSPQFSRRKYTMRDIQHITSPEILETVIDEMLDMECDTATDRLVQELHQLAMILPEKYYGQGTYTEWWKVGIALHNTDNRLFCSWVCMSQQLAGFNHITDVPALLEKWNNMPTNRAGELTHRSVDYWARTDSLEEYRRINTLMAGSRISDIMSRQTEFNFARLLHHMYKALWICVSVKNGVWYQFVDGRWLHCDSGAALRRNISSGLKDMFFDDMKGNVSDVSTGGSNVSEDTKSVSVNAEIVNKCERTAWKNNIMTEARGEFEDTTFLSKLDSNPKLLCFENGVVDFEQKVFRKSHPEDCLSMCTGYDYVPLSSMTTATYKQSIAELNDFINQLFPDKVLRDYMWDHMASILIGGNPDNVFNIYVGSGANGKSVFVELLKHCLGDYSGVVPITMVTQKRTGIGSATPEIAQLKGLRLAVMSEPSKGDKLNEGMLKELTGGDVITGRALFQEPITFRPQFKLAVCTNELFDIEVRDDGTWRRLHVNPFDSKFCDKPYNNAQFPEKEYPHQFEVDKHIKEKFSKWAPVLMAILVERAYKNNGTMKENKVIMDACNKYRSSQDFLLEFITDRIRKTDGAVLKKTELGDEFKRWYSEAYGKSAPRIREVTDYMEKRYGRMNRGRFEGIEINYEEYDEVEVGEGGE